MLPSRIDEDLRLEALRSVLIEQERAALAKLQQKFDDPEQFAQAVSGVLASAFALASTRDERLAAVIAPTMERATQASIRKDPGTMVGILYPLMGPVIRKSIAETLDGTLSGLNQAFKHSLSWQGLKWRLEAYRSGTSFADVVLKHTVVFRVEHLFLIHRKTGLLLEHVAAPQAAAQDPHLVSSMLAAIQDFVRDSFTETGSSSGAGGIHSVRLGDLLLWCEEGPSALLAAVIRGNPPDALHGVLRDTLARIHEELRTGLEDFNGDSAPLGDLASRLASLPAGTGTAAREDAFTMAVGAAARARAARGRLDSAARRGSAPGRGLRPEPASTPRRDRHQQRTPRRQVARHGSAGSSGRRSGRPARSVRPGAGARRRALGAVSGAQSRDRA